MKKLFISMSILALLLAGAVGLAACNKKHVHSFGEWVVEKQATCIEEGSRYHICDECQFKEEEVIAKGDHTPVSEGDKQATCLEDGYIGRIYCEVCNLELSARQPVAALQHEWGEYTHVEVEGVHRHTRICLREGCDGIDAGVCDIQVSEVPATCYSDAYTLRECSVCDYSVSDVHAQTMRTHNLSTPVFDEATHSHVVECQYDDCDYRLSTPCQFTDNVQLPTCTAQGYTRHTCNICGGYYDDDIKAANGHDFDVWVVTEVATCLKTGLQHHECKNCEVIEEEVIPQLEHKTGEMTMTKVPSCTEFGEKQLVCDICGTVVKTEQMDKLPHQFNTWHERTPATCSSEGVEYSNCESCGLEQTKNTQKLPHSIQKLTGYPATCDAAGLTDGEKCTECDYENAQVEIPALGHQWGAQYFHNENERTHYRICTRNPEHKDTEGCAGIIKNTAATCEEDGYAEFICEYCHHQYKDKTLDKLGHDYGEDYHAEIVKTEDGESGHDLIAAHKHTHYQLCRRCGDKLSEDCELQFESDRTATCTLQAIRVTSCDKCGSKHEVVTGSANGHRWGEQYYNGGTNDHPYHFRRCEVCSAYDYSIFCTFEIVVVQPTCDKGGYTAQRCTTCAFEWRKSKVTAALGHQLGGYEYIGDLSEHTHQRKCQRTDCEYSVEEACTMVPYDNAATCLAKGGSGEACKYCKVNISHNEYQQLDHQWALTTNKNDETHEQQCVQCHTTRQVPHSYDEVIIPADCENPGYSLKTCSDCRYQNKVQIADQLAFGHSWQPWTITDDTHHSECVTCHKVVEGGHDYSESNICSYCEHDGVKYELMGDHYVVKRNAKLSNTKRIVIKPIISEADYTEHPVTEIDNYAFANMSALEEVELPYTLEKIGDWAFNYCLLLRTVYINEEVRTPVPDGEDIVETKQAALKYIGGYAFKDDKSLRSFEAPESLLVIDDYAFDGCIALTDITINDSLQDLGSSVFRNTGYLTDESKWQGDVIYIGKHLIYARHQYDAQGTLLNKKISVRGDTLTIAANAFEQCALLEEIELPKGLEIVDRDAFINCVSLMTVTFDGNMEDWFKIHFVNDYSSPLHYAASMHIAEDHERVVIPETVTKIPAGTFRNTDIREVVIPETVTYIGANAFAGCANLANITIYDNVVYIGKDAFKGTAYMNEAGNWDDYGAFYVGNHLLATDPAKMKGDYEIRSTTVTIGIEAFAGCAELESFIIPEGVKRIGADLIEGCEKLSSVTFKCTEDYIANSKKLIISRVLDYDRSLQYPSSALFNLRTYNGEWVWYSLYGKY